MEEYHRAWQLAGQLRPDDAIPLLKAIIAKDPTFHRAYYTLVEAYRYKGDLGAAERYFQSLLERDPANGLTHYGLAELYDRQQRWDLAAQHYTRCVQLRPQAYPCYMPLIGTLASVNKNAIDEQDLVARIPDLASAYAHLARARLYDIQGKMPEAFKATQAGLEKARLLQDLELEATFHLLGTFSNSRNEGWAEALEHYKQSLRIFQQLGDWEGELRAGWGIVSASQRLGQHAQALAYAEGYISFARERGHRAGEAAALERLADCQSSQGDNEAALRSLWEAKRLYEMCRTPVSQLILRIGGLYAKQGDLREALRVSEEGLRLARQQGGGSREAFALRAVGVLHGHVGDYFRWLQHEGDAIRIFQELGMPLQAGAGLGNLAIAYIELGDYAKGLECYQQSLQSARRQRDSSEETRLLMNIAALFLRMERPQDALPFLNEALVISERVRFLPWQCAVRMGLGDYYKQSGQYARALENLTQASKLATQMGNKPLEAEALIELGDYYLKTGDVANAEALFTRGLELAQSMEYMDAVVAARRGLGEVFRRKRQFAESFRHLKLAVDAVENMRSKIPAPEERSGFLQENWKLYQETIHVLAQLDDKDRAFDYAEKGRARSLLDLLTQSDTRLRDTDPRYRKLSSAELYSLRRVQSELISGGAAVLEYALGEQESYLWVITRDRTAMLRLPARKDIEPDVAAYHKMIATLPRQRSSRDYRQASQRLYKLLVEPATPYLSNDCDLIIIPDGVLYYLPFETLASGPAVGAPQFLIENHRVSYAPSASVLGSLRTLPRRKDEDAVRKDLLAYGDPVFRARVVGGRQTGGTPITELVRGVYQSGGMSFPPLPNTRIEVEGIGKLYQPERRQIYLGRDATEASLKREKLTSYRRLHFATHSVIDEENPSRSGLVLSLVDTGDEDGVVRINEIFDLKLDADLVVLSACQTGLGKLVKGEGMVGMTRAFLYAGASRVAVSLWRVNDQATARFMKAFYQQMNQGAGTAEALRKAKLAMIQSNSHYRDPYFWAPFVLVGAP